MVTIVFQQICLDLYGPRRRVALVVFVIKAKEKRISTRMRGSSNIYSKKTSNDSLLEVEKFIAQKCSHVHKDSALEVFENTLIPKP